MTDVRWPSLNRLKRADAIEFGVLALLAAMVVQAARVESSGAAPPSAGGPRAVAAPTHIPVRGWRDILRRTIASVDENRIVAVAAGITFYALLAVFPAIAALLALYGLVADPANVTTQVHALSGILPDGAIQIVEDQAKRLAAQGGGKLGLSFFIGLAVSLYSANAGMKALFDGLNIAYHAREKRNFVMLNLQTLGFTLGSLVVLIVLITATVVAPIALTWFGALIPNPKLLDYARWPLMVAIVAFGLAFIYRFGPSRDKPRWRWVSVGGALASVLWLGGSALFSWYVSSFGNYDATYGSLGAVVGFMTWIWLSTLVILLGAELNAQIEAKADGA